jgi:hypothetical protein
MDFLGNKQEERFIVLGTFSYWNGKKVAKTCGPSTVGFESQQC